MSCRDALSLTRADAAWWAGRPGDCIDVLERAYPAYVATGNRARAGCVALSLAREYAGRLAHTVASGWLKRATRLLEAEPEGAEHAYLYARRSALALSAGYLDEAIELAQKSISLGQRLGDRNVEALGLVNKGMALVKANSPRASPSSTRRPSPPSAVSSARSG